MTMRPLSDCLDSVLLGLGIDARTAGTGRAGNKRAGSSRNGARRQSAAARKDPAAVRLIWVNPMSLRETPSREGQPGVSLKLVSSN